MKLLIDECLHTSLVKLAHDAGHEAYHVVYLGLAGATDPQLRRRLLRDEMVLVTNNARDFRGILARESIHPGLMVIVPNCPPAMQRALLATALQKVQGLADLINTVVEVEDDGTVTTYQMPPS